MEESSDRGNGTSRTHTVGTSFWRDRSTFVTGGTGFLGTAVVRQLVASGAQVVCLVRAERPESELARMGSRVRVVRGDVRDGECVERVLSEYEIDTVFHLAAQAIVGVANRNPVETFETNVAGTWRVLEACRRVPTVKQILLASSDKAYGDQPNLPFHEEMPPAGRHPYDVSKSCADLIAVSYAHSYGLPVAITRCANLFGGGDLNFNRIIPGTIRHVLNGEQPVIRSDGRFVRDYLYVEDGAAAYLLLAEQLAGRRELVGQAFNFSNEVRITALQLVRDVLRIMGSPLEPAIANQTVNEIRESYLSSRKAHEILGWQPLFSHEQALARTVDWYRAFLSDGSAHP